MRDVAVIGLIVLLSAMNLWLSVRSRREYRDLRSVRAVLNAIAVFMGSIALGVATWALQGHLEPEEFGTLVQGLVWLGQGVLLTIGTFLLYISVKERGRP